MGDGIFTLGLVDLGDGSSAMTPFPPKDNFLRWTSNTAYGTAGAVVSAKPARLYCGTFANASATTAYYVQFFNRSTLPVNGITPVWQIRLPAVTTTSGTADLQMAWVNGIPVQNGLTIALSSTPSVLTLAAANDLVFSSIIYTAQR